MPWESVLNKPRPKWRLPVLGFCGILLLLPLLEGAVRIRQLVRYGSARTELYQSTVDPVSGLTVPAPNQTTLHIRINSRSFRSPEIPVPKPPHVIRVAFLGESNTFSTEASSNEATWPSLLWKTLHDTWPNLEFDYINAAFPAYRVAESKRALEHRVKPLRPDVILINHASMDLYADSRVLAEKTGLAIEPLGKPDFLERRSLAWKLIKKNIQIWLRARQAAKSPQLLNFDPKALSQDFHQRLGELVDAAKSEAPVVALVTFPYKARRNQSPEEQLQNCSTSLFYAPWMGVQGMLNGIDEYNRVIREVAREKGVILIEEEDVIPGDAKHFHDSVHYKDAGSALMAAKAAAVLSRAEAFQTLVASQQAQRSREARTGSK
ncbi:MAG: SGNH/GDSL hydrolase family protein [Terriglobales bacterium]